MKVPRPRSDAVPSLGSHSAPGSRTVCTDLWSPVAEWILFEKTRPVLTWVQPGFQSLKIPTGFQNPRFLRHCVPRPGPDRGPTTGHAVTDTLVVRIYWSKSLNLVHYHGSQTGSNLVQTWRPDRVQEPGPAYRELQTIANNRSSQDTYDKTEPEPGEETKDHRPDLRPDLRTKDQTSDPDFRPKTRPQTWDQRPQTRH
ncbi:hypothetical protein WMY93_015326 [Mugilogobius chulae]|uniref:Uncharacterized protein n=1 Tax=Mugilogobius chulae TaxID=88201 RepID=A0AAW0NUF5_9GOBI